MERLQELEGDIPPKVFPVRVGQEEIGRILNLKENLDQHSALARYAARYLALDWHLIGVDAQGFPSLALDASHSQEVWSHRVMDFGLGGVPVNLAVRTGSPSRLLVLEVQSGEEETALTEWGDWRAECVCLQAGGWERHFYILPPGSLAPPSGFLLSHQVRIFGEGGVVMVPPSLEPAAANPWRWLEPPWETPLGEPKSGLLKFLKKQMKATLKAMGGPEPQLPSWEEVYPFIRAQGPVLQALAAPAASLAEYYARILHAAITVGFKGPALLLTLLWQAPWSQARQTPELWEYLEELVKEALELASGAAPETELGEGGRLPAPAAAWFSDSLRPGDRGLVEPIPPGAPAWTGQTLKPDAQAGAEEKRLGAPRPSRLAKSLAELFLEPKDKVVLERNRYDALLGEIKRLHIREFELERQLAEWEKRASPYYSLLDQAWEDPWDKWHYWSIETSPQMMQLSEGGPELTLDSQEVQSALDDFFNRNPDLATDPRKVRILSYCLRSQINMNRDMVLLPIREKLEKAGQLARNYLGSSGRVDG